MTGETISHYRIAEKLGEGGMGVVYKAEDTKLERPVALKFLAPHAIEDPEHKARFVREAKAAARLDHQNICPIYEIDETEGQTFLAMAYLEGQTLKDKIAERPLKLDEALDIAIQTAQGLKVAHQKEIVHRDIKPANLMLTEEGQVKIMDFGLAQLADRSRLTKTTTMLGTPAYMSPEQARRERTDRRTDVWSLGVVIYEMVTGRVPFEGERQEAVLYAIGNEEPESITALRVGVPTELDRIVSKALAKNPEERYQHVDEMIVDLRALRSQPAEPVSRSAKTRYESRSSEHSLVRFVPWTVALVACVIAAVAVWRSVEQSEAPHEAQVRRFSYQPPRRLSGGTSTFQRPNIAVSPSGNRVAHLATFDGVDQLVLRDLDQDQPRALPGTAGAHGPFFSPDGEHLGFFADGKLKRIALNSDTVTVITNVLPVSNGGTWGQNDEIYFALIPRSGLKRVAASGGEVKAVTVPHYEGGEAGHMFPHILPGGESILFTVWSDTAEQGLRIAALTLETGEWTTVIESGTSARYSGDGYLVFGRDGKLNAVPFDPDRLEVTGPSVVVAEGVDTLLSAEYDLSREGTLVYGQFGVWPPARTLSRLRKDGTAETVDAPHGVFMDLSVSPDGESVAVTKILDAAMDVWVKSLPPNPSPLTRLTFSDHLAFGPVWTPDNRRVTYTQAQTGTPPEIYWKPADGTGVAERLFEMPHAQFPTCWSPDGEVLAFNHEDPVSNSDIYLFHRTTGETQAFRSTTSNEGMAKFHPAGRWLAYHSDRSGQYEVYVADYPSGPERQVSPAGGTNPVWSPDGTELFFRTGDKFWRASTAFEPKLIIGEPELLFEHPHQGRGNYADSYGIAADGTIVTIDLDPAETKPSEISIVLNWQRSIQPRR